MSGGQAPPTTGRKKPAMALHREPGPCPYMGSRKWLGHLPYVIPSKFSLDVARTLWREGSALQSSGRSLPLKWPYHE